MTKRILIDVAKHESASSPFIHDLYHGLLNVDWMETAGDVYVIHGQPKLLGIAASGSAFLQAYSGDAVSTITEAQQNAGAAFVGAPRRHPERKTHPTVPKIEDLGGLEDDWDSYGASPPTKLSLERAAKLVHIVRALYEGAYPFDIAPIPSGGVQLEWRGADAHIEVEVGAGGSMSYLLKRLTPNGRVYQEGHGASWHDLLAQFDRVLLA